MVTVDGSEPAGCVGNVRPVRPGSAQSDRADVVPTPSVVRVCQVGHTPTSPAMSNLVCDVLNAASMLSSNTTAPSRMMPSVTDVVKVVYYFAAMYAV